MDSQVKEAKRLRKKGLIYKEIAAELGISKTRAFALLNPEYQSRSLESARKAKQARKTPCPSCGKLVSYDRPGEMCEDCKLERKYGERNRRIFEAWRRGDKFEYWHGDPEGDEAPHFYGLNDDEGQLVALLCHNNDIGDGWEREGEDIEYFKEYSERYSYPLGINIVAYAMTH